MDDNDLKIIEGIKKHLPPYPIIFDVGANRGDYTDYVLTLFPNACILMIEPNDMWVIRLREKYSNNSRIAIYPALITSAKGEQLFYYFTNNNDQLSSIYKRPVFSDLPMKEQMRCSTTIDRLIAEEGLPYVHFVKVDTEGAEFDVLKGAIESLKGARIKFIQIEYGGTYPDAGITMREVIDFVNSFGYNAYSFNGVFTKLDSKTFIEDFHYDNYLITNVEL